MCKMSKIQALSTSEFRGTGEISLEDPARPTTTGDHVVHVSHCQRTRSLLTNVHAFVIPVNE